MDMKQADAKPTTAGPVATMSYAAAAADALARQMRSDRSVVALGEDLGRGGIFGQYKGLAAEFGADIAGALHRDGEPPSSAPRSAWR